MVIFHSYVKLPEGILPWVPKNLAKTWENGTLKIWEMIILPWVPKNVAKTWENGILFDLGDDHPRQKPCPTRCISKFVIVQKLPPKKILMVCHSVLPIFQNMFFPKKVRRSWGIRSDLPIAPAGGTPLCLPGVEQNVARKATSRLVAG